MPLFEVAILEKPNKTEADSGGLEKLVFGPKCIIARDGHAAAISAVLGEEKPTFDLSRAEVIVRPFK